MKRDRDRDRHREPLKTTGAAAAFDDNWQKRKEASYTHWTAGEPQNQIQLAFRNHWTLFNELMGTRFKGRRSLEVGCGRGSISCYFSAAGYDATCLDFSQSVLDTAAKIFAANALKAKFIKGDALDLPFRERSFDVTVSIGLLEHFEDVQRVIAEQVRVLDTGGIFLGYVVPENRNNVQKDYRWINDILKAYAGQSAAAVARKEDVYRSDVLSAPYLAVMKDLPLRDIGASGTYPLPMISPSPEFPFTLMPDDAEARLVTHFQAILDERRRSTGKHPWLCDESYGQAFLLWGFKE